MYVIQFHRFIIWMLAFLAVSLVSAAPKLLNICELDQNSVMFCNCDDFDKPTDVTCFATNNNSTAEHPVWEGFKSFSTISMFKLTAFNGGTTKFNYFPHQILPYSRESLIKLVVSDVDLSILVTGAIKQMDVLEDVEFKQCKQMTVERDAFQSLPALKRVAITDSNFGTLVDMFEDVPAIEELFLENNQISLIEPKAFSALKKLQFLELKQNKIQSITRESFTGLSNLINLDLNWNKLKHLPAYTFAEMPQLTEIELISNEIEEIDANAFANLPNLQSIKLERNQLRTFPAAGIFAKNYQLAVVDLAFNEFEYLSWQVFYQAEKGRYIRMRIKGNNIKCTCSIFWMSEALKYYDSIVEQELQTMDCKYETSGSEQLHFEKSRPMTILGFITNPEVAKQCKLPTALVKASQNVPTPDGAIDEDDDEEEEEVNKLPKVIDLMDKQAEKDKVAVGKHVENPDNDLVNSHEEKVTHVFENGVDSSKSTAETEGHQKSPQNKSPELSHASFGQGSSSQSVSSNVVAFLLLVTIAFTLANLY